MDPLVITGWLFLLASWFPKPFIEDYRIRRGLNLTLSGIASGLFITFLILNTK